MSKKDYFIHRRFQRLSARADAEALASRKHRPRLVCAGDNRWPQRQGNGGPKIGEDLENAMGRPCARSNSDCSVEQSIDVAVKKINAEKRARSNVLVHMRVNMMFGPGRGRVHADNSRLQYDVNVSGHATRSSRGLLRTCGAAEKQVCFSGSL